MHISYKTLNNQEEMQTDVKKVKARFVEVTIG